MASRNIFNIVLIVLALVAAFGIAADLLSMNVRLLSIICLVLDGWIIGMNISTIAFNNIMNR